MSTTRRSRRTAVIVSACIALAGPVFTATQAPASPVANNPYGCKPPQDQVDAIPGARLPSGDNTYTANLRCGRDSQGLRHISPKHQKIDTELKRTRLVECITKVVQGSIPQQGTDRYTYDYTHRKGTRWIVVVLHDKDVLTAYQNGQVTTDFANCAAP